MALDPETYGTNCNNILKTQASDPLSEDLKTPTNMAKLFAAEYDKYAKAGTLAGADLTAGGDITILEAGFIPDNTTAMATKIATAICGYWATLITPAEEPEHGGTSVTLVVIPAMTLLPAMIAAVQATVTDEEGDGWIDLFNNTEAIVKTIPCVITELVGAPPVATTFPETIS